MSVKSQNLNKIRYYALTVFITYKWMSIIPDDLNVTVRSRVLTAMTVKCTVFWDVTPCTLMPSGLWYYVVWPISTDVQEPAASILRVNTEDEGSKFLWNICTYHPYSMPSHPKNKLSTFHLYSPLSCAYHRILFLVLFLTFSLATILNVCYFITPFLQSNSRNMPAAFVAVELTYVPHFGFSLFHAIFIPSCCDDHS